MSPDSNPEISALKNQMFTLLLALIVVSGTVTTYLFQQARLAGKDLDAIRPKAQQLIGTFNQDQSLMISFVNQLIDYGKTHPEFRPVLAKYGITLTPTAPAK